MSQNPWKGAQQNESLRSENQTKLTKQSAERLRGVWEQQTREKQIEVETWRRFYQIKHEQSKELAERRQAFKLATLEEETRLLAERTTPADEKAERYAKLKAKALQLEEDRRLANLKLVNEKYEQQFRFVSDQNYSYYYGYLPREGCDLLRKELSKRKAQEISEDRRVQIIMNQQAKQLAKEQELYFDRLQLEQQQLSPESQLECAKKAEERRELVNVLHKQIQQKEAEKQEILAGKIREHQEMEKQNQELNAEKERLLQEKFLRRNKIRHDLDICLQAKRERLAGEQAKVNAVDTMQLKQAKEQAVKQREGLSADKRRAKKECLQYMDYVRQTKKAEQLYERQLECMVDDKVNQEAQKAAECKARERAARKALIKETADVCRQQIEQKSYESVQEKLSKIKEAAELKTILDKTRQETEKQLVDQQMRLENYRQQLEAQISERHQQEAQMQEERKREQSDGQRTEAIVQQRVYDALHSELDDADRHPWRKMLAHQHPDIPVWTGMLAISPYNRALK
ncbi:hypothetical protein EG68_10913 [Paragonimus skrjabini miyazakii]|uniref:Trichohyalin-plectin-homology domain-containing protein n=1 Tax=Paragonimus skrjabini miyazakii TaxID=59628 RepID=A0A8S9YJ88_9TREM|nr:hypothetical protein EG68_10913 [Paragonimus skrjabini miyazakii]